MPLCGICKHEKLCNSGLLFHAYDDRLHARFFIGSEYKRANDSAGNQAKHLNRSRAARDTDVSR